jgi:hypothetical protein
MRTTNIVLALCAAVMLVTGCARQRGPANEALESVEKSLAEVRTDAAKYAPDGLKGVESQFERLKASYEAKEYDNVLAGAPQLQKAVASLKNAVDSGKAQAKAAFAAAKSEWESLKVEVPKQVETIQARVDELSKKKRLPFGVTKEEFEGAKAGLTSMKSIWADAESDFNSGKATMAVNKGKTVQGMAAEIRDRLNIRAS